MTYTTRIQLKSDIETNWNKLASTQNSDGFIPLDGELIIYSADNDHLYSRAKIGDGKTNVTQLPFIDAGTINGNEVEIVKIANYDSLPSTGSPDKLYVDLSTNNIYHYDNMTGYSQLSNFTYVTGVASKIDEYQAATATTARIENNILKITNGTSSYLSWQNIQTISEIRKP